MLVWKILSEDMRQDFCTPAFTWCETKTSKIFRQDGQPLGSFPGASDCMQTLPIE